MKDSATQSTPVASTASRSLRSFSVSAPTGSSVSGRLTPFLSEILLPATTLQTIALPSLETALSCSLPSSISSRSPASTEDRISGCGRCTRVASPGAGLSSSVKIWPSDSSTLPSANLPTRSFGPCRSARMPIGRPRSSSTLRMRPTSACIEGWSVWLMLMRKRSAPASNNFLIVSVSDDAGPSVARILTLRLLLIGPLCR